MSAFTISLIVFACLCGGMFLGIFLRRILPDPHLQDESKDAIRVGIGLIATLTALVLGLLIASTKNAHDAVNTGLVQGGANIVALDRTLAQYGPQTADARLLLRNSLAAGLARYWPEVQVRPPAGEPLPPAPVEALYAMVQKLTPQDSAQRNLQSRALQICNDLLHSRWLLLEEAQSELPTPFLIIVVFWLAMLFTSFSLLAPRNITVDIVFAFCALSVAGALFLLIELGHPSDGLMKASAAPLVRAYSVLGR